MVKNLRKSIKWSLRDRGAHNSVKLVILAILLLYSCKRAQAGQARSLQSGSATAQHWCDDIVTATLHISVHILLHVRTELAWSVYKSSPLMNVNYRNDHKNSYCYVIVWRRSTMKYGIWLFTGEYGGYGRLSKIGDWISSFISWHM